MKGSLLNLTLAVIKDYREHGLVNEDSVWIAGSPMSSMRACGGTTFSPSLSPDLNKTLGVMDEGTEDSS